MSGTELCTGLRAMADLIEKNPEGPWEEYQGWLDLQVYCTSNEQFGRAAKALGACQKEADENFFTLRKNFASNLTMRVYRARKELCERVKVGEKIVPATPEIVIPEKVIPAQAEHVEDIYEWQCPDSVLGLAPPIEELISQT